MNLNSLKNPFPAESIHWRVGATTKDKSKGLALAYIDARDVMDRLDEVCGPEGWQVRYPAATTKTICEIGIKIGDEWVWKSDGAGDTDVEGAKGAFSDALKRAAVHWGIGRYLYSLDSPWVALEQQGNTHVIAKGEYSKLRSLLNASHNKAWEGAPGEKVAVGDAIKAYWQDIMACEEHDQFIAARTNGAYPIRDKKHTGQELENMCANLFPTWWSGKDDQKGLSQIIVTKEIELMNKES